MYRTEFTPTQARKKRAGLCIEPFCMKKAAKKSHRCHACARADWAERNPEKYIFCNLRGNARRRGKEFGITFEEFRDFLTRENYLKRKRGRTRTSVSVDRKKNDRGYFPDNLQALTIHANSEKMHYVDYYRRQFESVEA